MGSLDNFTYYQIGDRYYSVEIISDTFCELILFRNGQFVGSWDFEGPLAYGEALARILEDDEITREDWENM